MTEDDRFVGESLGKEQNMDDNEQNLRGETYTETRTVCCSLHPDEFAAFQAIMDHHCITSMGMMLRSLVLREARRLEVGPCTG